MKKNAVTMVSLRLDAGLVAALDAWRERQPATPSKTASIEAAIRLLIAAKTAPQPRDDGPALF